MSDIMPDQPLLIVLAGRPGTGKTTLGQALARELRAAFLRIDAIETAVVRCGLAQPPVGPVGYAVAHEIAAATLALGTPVVIDAVNPVPEARSAWWALASSTSLVIFETVLADDAEHRRRVEARQPDLADQTVPTWEQVLASDYLAWDEARDGPRHVIDMTDTKRGVTAALAHLQQRLSRLHRQES
ncbi:MAG: AAA family ATPase [Jatrophihabitantaceae bacterium]